MDTDLFAPHRRTSELRDQLGADTVVGYVGRLAAEKELDLLGAIQDLPGTRLVVVGGGPEEARLRDVLPRAEFLGVRHGHDLARIVASLDVFVHTGRTETFCQSAQEALASGVPVVAPCAGGPVDLVDHGSNGFLYEPGDAEALHRHMARLVGDEPLRRAMGVAATRSVRVRSWAAVNAQLLEHYRDVTGVQHEALPFTG